MFREEFFGALNSWQRGWLENQEKRIQLAQLLEAECTYIDESFKQVSQLCYRKRFIHSGEYVDILLRDFKDEGITSWTTDLTYAEMFKGKAKADASHAAIFEHQPETSEIILNIASLWKNSVFISELDHLSKTKPEKCDALLNFRDYQKEVILRAPLKGSEIIGLTGVSSSFDALCDIAGIPEDERPAEYRRLIGLGHFIEELKFVKGDASRRAVRSVIDSFKKKHPDFRV